VRKLIGDPRGIMCSESLVGHFDQRGFVFWMLNQAADRGLLFPLCRRLQLARSS
jgi:hypothetical protein